VTLAADRPGRGSPFPLIWLGGAILLACLSALELAAPTWALPPDAAYANQDTYYVIAHWQRGASLLAACLVIAGLYRLFDLFRFRYRRALAWWHLGMTVLGICLISAPMWLLRMGGMPRRFEDVLSLFSTLTRIANLGYIEILASLAVFVWLIVEAIVCKRRAESR
jgi:heme/copper-type cytochrome/quinol oxidase subunit 1